MQVDSYRPPPPPQTPTQGRVKGEKWKERQSGVEGGGEEGDGEKENNSPDLHYGRSSSLYSLLSVVMSV